MAKYLMAMMLGLAAGAPVRADDATATHQFSGNARINYYHVAKELERRPVDVLGATGDVIVESNWGESSVSSKAVLRWHDPELGRGGASVQMQQAYVLWRSERLDIKLGKQVVAWGRADGINPTDNLTPRNYRVQLPYEDDQREGVGALRMDFYPSAQENITLFLSPGIQPSKLPLPQAEGWNFSDQQPARGRWPVGLKYDRRGERLDGSISYYRGYKLVPEWLAGEHSIDLHYPKISVFGADAAANWGRYGWRGEVARVVRDEPQTAGGFRSNWTLVTGVDRNFDDDLNVNVQLIAQQNGSIADWANIVGSRERGLALANAITFSQTSTRKFGSTIRIGKQWWHGTLQVELLGFAYFRPDTSYWRPLLSYAPRDNVKLTVGAELYTGRADSYFGGNKSLQGPFAELRYQFQ